LAHDAKGYSVRLPYDPMLFSERVARLVNQGSWRRATKSRVWGGTKNGYGGVATADRINRYGGTAIAER